MTDPEYPHGPPAPPPAPWQPSPPPAPVWQPPPPPPPSPPANRRALVAVAVAAGLVALAGGIAFAVEAFGGGEPGAATPEEAGLRLVEAVADEDVLGVVELLAAGERDVLRDVVEEASDHYEDLGLLSESFSLDGFPGVDITAEDVEVEVEVISEGIAQVFVTGGDFRIEVDGDEVVANLGDVVEEVADARDADLDVDDTAAEADADEDEPIATFVVVEEDGRWHPSLGFTLAELARQSSGAELDEPDLGGGIRPEGASSPEGAVQALLDAGLGLDPEAAVAGLDPGEMQALQVYLPLFLDDGEADGGDEVVVEAELTSAEVDGLGGGANRVVPTGLEVRFEADGGTGEVVLDDGCVRIDIRPPEGEGDPIDEEVCGDDDVPDAFAGVELPAALQEVVDAFQPLRFGIVTVERDGEHFVAPVRTLADVVLGVTRGLEREDLEEGGAVFALLSGELDDELEELFDRLAEANPVLDDDGAFDDELFDDGDEPPPPCEGPGCGFGDGP